MVGQIDTLKEAPRAVHGSHRMYWLGCRCAKCQTSRAEYQSKYRATNYERERKQQNEAGKRYAAKSTSKLAHRTREAKRRGTIISAAGFASEASITARWAYYGNKCWMCGDTAVETDHVIPLVRNGSNWPANLRPACRSCNASKGSRVA